MPKSLARNTVLVAFILGLATACGGRVDEIVRQPPLVEIDGIHLQSDRLHLTLAVRNFNDRPVHFDHLVLQLSLDNAALVESAESDPFDIAPRSRELVHLEVLGQAPGRERLDALASGELRSLRWRLRARLTDPRGRERTVDNEGWLHVVPGQPHRFR